jgi:hypothetical protein
MKAILVFIIVLFVSAPIQAAQNYVFETLVEQAQPLPSNILKVLRESEAESWKDCRRQLDLSNDDMARYFTAIPISLSRKKGTLVLPTKYCYAFFGAHAVSFWVFLTDGTEPKLVLSGRQDGLRVLDTEVQGLAIVETYYGTTTTQFLYNGNSYVEVKK